MWLETTKYNFTKRINEKRNLYEELINNLPIIDDWLNLDFIKTTCRW